MKRLLLGLCLALPLLTAGCSDILAPRGKINSLREARELWASKGFTSYQYTLRWSCFCGFTAPLVVTVSNGVVVSVFDTESKKLIDTRMGKTIDGLFDFIDEAIDERAARIEAQYDATLGYPTRIDYDGATNIADDELSLTASNVVQGTAPAAPARLGSAPAVTLPLSILTAAP